MYHPSTRLLTVLELLQTHAALSGEELARRLEVEPRTVRRYILMLQDMGMPVEANRGPGGGYRLRPGFKLPPLLFTEEEATAVVLGLIGTAWLELGFSAAATEGALAKISRVLPQRARERLQAVAANLSLHSLEQTTRPDASLVLSLSQAIQQQQRIFINYHSPRGEPTQRTVEPYGLTGWRGLWYLVAYCCLRQDYRVFRLDRMQQVEILSETFTKDEDFDPQAYIIQHDFARSVRWTIEVVFDAPLSILREKVPPSYGTLTETPKGVKFETMYEDLDGIARYLMGLNVPFIIHQPQELRDALARLAEQIRQIAVSEPE